MSTAPDPAEGAWSRVITLAGKLAEALDQLDDLGGAKRLDLKPKSVEKGRQVLSEARAAIDAQLAELKARRRTAPPGRSPGGPPRRRVESPGRPGPLAPGPGLSGLADRVAEWARDMTEFDPD